ncbi:MAG: spermidine/putrescine ABC transporter ATP-binding protein [Rhodobacteraceae bacterium]|nr:spermidine/putrescine ABC transporter ATP-binding protein [Paracoccaceae bacterium]MAY47092.1 spermidine/putrescine ABC transporter ATP-binding protein [Paracoccaceae bacterium]
MAKPPLAQKITGSPVRFEGLSKTYGPVTAVQPMDLDVRAGEFLSFLGPSGSGKTTTLMMLAGFESPSTGRIVVGDIDITAMPPAKRNIGMVFQNYALFPHMTVEQNVAFPLRMRGIPASEQAKMVGEMLGTVGLGDFRARFPAQLSGGQQQRVALARAIVFKPPVLLMDEPLSALDKYLRSRLQIEIKRIQRDLGITVVYVTHDQDEAMTMSDRICVMRDGGIAQLGAPETLYRAPADEFVAGFLGESNMFCRPLKQSDAGRIVVDMKTEDLVLPVRRTPVGDHVKLAVRPEHLHFHPDADGPATVRDVTYVGDHRRYELALDDGTILVAKAQETDGVTPVAPGARVALDWPVSQMRAFSDGLALQ